MWSHKWNLNAQNYVGEKDRKGLNQRESCEGSWVKTTDPTTEETKAQELGGNHGTVSAYKEYFPNHTEMPQSWKHSEKDKFSSRRGTVQCYFLSVYEMFHKLQYDTHPLNFKVKKILWLGIYWLLSYL